MPDVETKEDKDTKKVISVGGKDIEISERLGSFVARVIGEPVENAVGIVGDKLKFMRWERQLRLIERVEELTMERGNLGKEVPVPPKLVIPILENASLEEEDQLQDLWAKMIVSSQDEDSKEKVRSAFIDIIKQLESKDVTFLNALYLSAIETLKSHPEARETQVTFARSMLLDNLGLDDREYENVVDNLMRVRCVKSEVKVISSMMVNNEPTTIDKGYESLCLTEFGINFIESCVK